jgi:hypothetical protein
MPVLLCLPDPAGLARRKSRTSPEVFSGLQQDMGIMTNRQPPTPCDSRDVKQLTRTSTALESGW